MNVSNFAFVRPPLDSNPFIIPEPEGLKEPTKVNNKSVYKYSIDSRDRNLDSYPTPSKYAIEFYDGVIKDVISIELLTSNVPFSRYNIHDHNNKLHFVLDSNPGQVMEAVVPPGNYTEALLCERLDTILSVDYDIHCTYEAITQRCIFSSPTILFKLALKGSSYVSADKKTQYRMRPDSIGSVVGFTIHDDGKANTVSSDIKSKYPMNLRIDDYIIMHIRGAKVFRSNNGTVDNCFAIIRNSDSDNLYDPPIIMKTFSPPLASLNTLDLSFYDYNGNLYDFNNKDHNIEFRFTVMKQGMRI